MQKSENQKVQIACVSDIGKKRKNNEDATYACKTPYGTILIVCDGMGGHRKGEVASKVIVDSLAIPFNSHRRVFSTGSAKKFCHKALKKANKNIYKMSLEGQELKEMGSTVVCALIAKNGTYVISLGDSRLYSYSKTGGLIHRTTDQTYVELLFETGRISRAEMANHPQKNLLINAVGINPDLSQIQETVLDNDSYQSLMLCSDGLYNMVDDETIKAVLANDELDADGKAKALLNKALDNGGNDNIAVVIWEK